ncbi:MAG: DUF6288 domain-containing protein [Akkermansiaceae bacterium]
MKTRYRLPFIATLGTIAVLANSTMAAPPDLTAGGVPNEDPAITFNLGPTGMRGWAYHVKQNSGESRQILVTAVDAGSPAAGILAVDDVILGADGTGGNPVNFGDDARKSLAYAIADAEARNPATLKLLRWRGGTTTTVSLTLQTLGAYSATAPYNCPKSAVILQNGLQYVYNNETAGRYSFGAITLLADGNATYAAKAQAEARALVPSQATINQLMSDDRDASSMITWQRGHTLVFLAEYYLATGDTQVLPAIEAYAVNIAKNQSLFGTVGHIFAEKKKDGSANGPMGGVYGVVNSAGMPCFLGVLLAKECGLTNPELDPAIETSSRFFAYYVGKGSIPYGEHEPYAAHESNGKSGLGALYFTLQNDRVEEGKFFSKMATAAANERELGHTGAWFNYLWAPLGAAAGGEEAAAAHFSRISWMLDLSRRWDWKFQYDCLNGEGPKNGASYHDFKMSTAALLTYALPHRKLRITGKGHDTARWLSNNEVSEAIAADDYEASGRSNSELISDLGNWSPKVRKLASKEIGNRSVSGSELTQITGMANDVAASAHQRAGACLALGEIGDASSAAPLAALLTDAENYVRYAAGEAIRYLPTSAKMAEVDTILAAAASTAAPLYPMVEEDPLQFAHAKLGMVLFYSGNAYGPKGILWNSSDGVDRNLLYPAIRAMAHTPVGIARSTLAKTYENLPYEDVIALSGTIADSIIDRAPADRMFSNGIRNGGVKAFQKYDIAEGVPAVMVYAGDESGGRRREPLRLLGTFGGGVHTVQPDPDAISFLETFVAINETSQTAQEAIDAINADTNPSPLMALKSIQSATADDTTLSLPTTSTVLRVTAIDAAEGDSSYTWRQVSGPGAATFTPNGNAAAANTTVEISGSPGAYVFEVTMSDSRELTEAYATISLLLVDGSGVDTTPPTLSSITDDRSGGPILDSESVVYTVSFSESMNGTTIGVDDFEIIGSASASIDSVAATGDAAVYQVAVTASSIGNIRLQLKSGAVLEDLFGNVLNTSSSLADDTIIVITETPQGIGVVSSIEGSGAGGAGNKTIAAGYDASGADKLVVVLGGEHGFPGNTGGRFYSVTYAGTALTEAVQEESGVPTLAIFYLDNPGAPGDLIVNQDNHNSFVYKIYQITGTAPGVGATSKATSNAVNLTTTAGDSLVIAGILNAGPNGGNGSPNLSADAPLNEDTATDIYAGSRWVSLSTGSALVASAGSDTYSFSNAGGSDLLAIGTVEFPYVGVPPDVAAPTLIASDILNDHVGGIVARNSTVNYTFVFSEPIDAATLDVDDFINLGSAMISIVGVSELSPGVIGVEVLVTSQGTLQLAVAADAVIQDLAGNSLDTSSVIADDLTLDVGPAMIAVPDVTGLAQTNAESALTSAGLVVGSTTTATDPIVPEGNVISQNPTSGTTLEEGSTVSLVISEGTGAPPLKVFILAGQSNMEGHGEMNPLGTPGTLESLVNSNPAGYGHLKSGQDWAVRDDAWIWYKRGGTTLLKGGLSAGYGAKATTIGPELQFGHVLGEAYGEQILIIKTAWGGKSLAVDFRPPSSGWSVNPPTAAGEQGFYYQEMMSYVNDVLSNLPTYFPEYNSGSGYELAGFGWHQGWNDRVNQAHNDQYEVNMKNFIDDVRSDLGAPSLPFVIATTGMTGWSDTHPRALSLMAAQLAMEDASKYPAFTGNVAVVDTRNFWREASDSPSNQGYHWNRNAETYCLIGASMAQEMQALITGSDDLPPVPNPASFALAPTAADSNSITMTATLGSDPSGPVEYLFTETSGSPGASSSGWQTTASFTDDGLDASTTYSYTVTLRDAAGYVGNPSVAVSATTSAPADVTPPTLASADIIDNRGGGPIGLSSPVVYMVAFSEPMNASTIGIDDFGNAGSAPSVILGVSPTTDAAVFEVTVDPGGVGTLQLQLLAGALLEDVAGNALETTAGIADDTVIGVSDVVGDVSIVSFTEGQGLGGAGLKTIAAAYDASAADKLVVVLGGEHGFPNNPGGNFYGVTYGGVPLTEAAQENNGVPTVAVFYLDDPGAAGDIVVHQDNHNRTIYTIYQLNGTAPGVGASAIAANTSVNLATTADNSFVIAGILNAGPNGGNGAPNLVAEAPLVEDTVTDLFGGSRWVSLSSGSCVVSTAGAATYSFSNAGATDLVALAAVEFLASVTPPDTTPPSLLASEIIDDQAGSNVVNGTLVNYTLSFTEDIDETTLQAGDFSNAGSAQITIDGIIEILPGIFSVDVTPISIGSLQLAISAGAEVLDPAGNALDTTTAIADDTILMVEPVMVPVPELVGLTQSAAEAAITGGGLTVGVVATSYSNAVPAGDVISQGLAAGSNAVVGSSVDFVVSLGIQMVSVPNLVGLTQSAAEAAITGLGLSIGAVNNSYSETVPMGSVISQGVAPGSSVAIGAPVDLLVSSGPAPNNPPVVDAGSDQTFALSGNSWSPESLVPALWLDASDTESITLAAGKVAEWGDKSGNNRNATQTTATNQPTLTSGGLNGMDVLTFDGSSDFLNVDLDFMAGVDHSVFVVTKTTAHTDIYGAANGGSGSNSLHVGYRSSSSYRMNYWANDWYGTVSSNHQSGATNLLNFVWQPGVSKEIFANGFSEGTTSNAGLIATMSGGGRISNVVGHGFYGGDLAEFIVFDRALTLAERQSMEGFLAHKWGTDNLLEAEHPHKAQGPDDISVTVTLAGTASDADDDALTPSWTVVSGPAAVEFSDASAVGTDATFTVAGTYVLRLTTADGTDTVFDEVTITVDPVPDTTAPLLAVSDIVDNREGNPVTRNEVVAYTLSFSEDIDEATFEASDLSNAGTSNITIESITETDAGVFEVNVIPTEAGTLQLQVSAGVVISDLAGNPLDTATAIVDESVITVDPLMLTVPNVIGLTQSAAESSIASVGFSVGTVATEYSNSVANGDVISQGVASGSQLSEGSTIDFTISLGVEMVNVPDLVGLSQSVAGSSITAAQLSVGSVTSEFSNTVPLGDVISQGLSAGASVPINSAVDLVVSLGIDSSPKLVRTTVSSVSSSDWTSVDLGMTYNSPIIIATPIYPDNSQVPVVTRITNVTSTGFDLKIDRTDGQTAPVTVDVSIIAVDEGIYTQAVDGVTMEAVKYTSTVTARKGSWVAESRSFQNTYISPIVVGQVMSANDPKWSVFWSMGNARGNPVNATNLNVGKHIGEDSNTSRADETVGYIVIESGSGSISGVDYEAGIGGDNVRGIDNSTNPYSYSLSGNLSSASAAAVSIGGMDGGDGGWAVLGGSSAISPTNIRTWVDEDVLKDSERKHTTEQIGYLIFE